MKLRVTMHCSPSRYSEMLKHFFEVSRTMPAEQGKRYLAWVQTQTCLHEQTMNHSQADEANNHE